MLQHSSGGQRGLSAYGNLRYSEGDGMLAMLLSGGIVGEQL